MILVRGESWPAPAGRERLSTDAARRDLGREREREREREMLKLKTEGKTAAEIVNAVGIGRASVLRILKEAA